MASSFSSSFLPFRKNPAAQINTTQQPTPSFSRTMASGRCTAVLIAGTLEIPCTCPRGEFEIEVPLTAPDVGCKVCTHPLSQHEDASSTNPPSVHKDFSPALGQNSLPCRDNCSC